MATVIPHPVMYSTNQLDYTGFQPKVTDDTIATAGFVPHLESYHEKAPLNDQQRCEELLDQIQHTSKPQRPLSGTYRVTLPPNYRRGFAGPTLKRPKSAMAALGELERENAEFLNPYQTTYKKEYFERDAYPADAERPSSSQGFTAKYDLSGPIGDTTYGSEFPNKGTNKQKSIRAGSSSGNRRNNPHPLEAFMVWKFPNSVKMEQPNSEWATELTDEMMDKVCRGKTKSTYQSDFMGIPQGFQVKEGFNVKDDWRSNVPYTLDSCKRWSYQKPNQQAILKENTTRYGCNKNKTIPVSGTVPSVSSRQLQLKKNTTYEREYTNRLPDNIQAAKEYQRIYGTENLRRAIEANGTTREKSALQRLLSTSRALGTPGRVTSRGRVETPKWVSSYPGPM